MTGYLDDENLDGDDAWPQVQATIRRFVELTIVGRVGNGTWEAGTGLWKFRVEFDGEHHRVRVNDEAEFWSGARLARSVGPGESIGPSDIETHVVEVDGEAPAVRYIDAELVDGRWTIDTRLQVLSEIRHDYLAVAREFAEEAGAALDRSHLRVFYENAFHAAEHAARAELLSYSPAAADIESAKTHAALRSAYQLWAHLENTDVEHAKLLNRLGDVRSKTTYSVNQPTPTIDDARSDFEALWAMLVWAGEVVAGRGREIIRLHATRDLTAGEFVGLEDAVLRPPRPRSRP